MKILKPYYRKGNKYFFRHKKQKMTIQRFKEGVYKLSGDIIQRVQLQISQNEIVSY